jgi:hypothetical protein
MGALGDAGADRGDQALTYTTAIMGIPRAAWDIMAMALEEAGYDREVITMAGGVNMVALDMTHISVVATDDSDMVANSGRLSDFAVQSNEEAFRAGFAAGRGYDPSYGFPEHHCALEWGRYTPSDDIMELQDAIAGRDIGPNID